MQTNTQTRLRIQSYIIEELTREWKEEDKIKYFEQSFDHIVQSEFKARQFPNINTTVIKQ
jgi:hypothetical protein